MTARSATPKARAEPAEPILAARGIVNCFGKQRVHDGIDLDIGVGEILGIAGGSGLSPILSVARKALGEEPGRNRQVYLFLGGRRPADIVDPNGFADIQQRAEGRLHFYPAISEPTEVSVESWNGERGYIHEIVAQRAPRSIGRSEIFVAGPPPMIRETLTILSSLGVPREQVHFDNFF